MNKTTLDQYLADREVKPEYDKRHGGPWDRGSADSYYCRPPKPHYYKGGTGMTPKIEEKDMTPEEVEAYWAGFNQNEAEGNFKYLGDF